MDNSSNDTNDAQCDEPKKKVTNVTKNLLMLPINCMKRHLVQEKIGRLLNIIKMMSHFRQPIIMVK